jgi:GMP synthase (glutamine-hydrolysing)
MRVLSVTHGPDVPGGVFENETSDRGHHLDHWSAPDGGSPGPAKGYDAVLVFGSSAHPDEDDRFAWLAHEEEFLREVLAERVPVFGVCLGAQMLARAAGARVAPARTPEIGWYEVELTRAGHVDPVLGVMPARSTVFQWHRYTYEVPTGGAELARSTSATQAFHLPPSAWGIQFHAEITLPMLIAWAEEEPEELLAPLDDLVSESRARIGASNALGRALCAAFLEAAERGAQATDATSAPTTSSTTSFAADA